MTANTIDVDQLLAENRAEFEAQVIVMSDKLRSEGASPAQIEKAIGQVREVFNAYEYRFHDLTVSGFSVH